MSRTVDYSSVIGRLTDAIKELNQPHAKDPTESAKRVAEERRQDAAKLLRALLRALEQNPAGSGAAGAAGASAAAAAERSAGALGSKVYTINVQCYYQAVNARGQLSFSQGPTVQVLSTDSVNGAKGKVHERTYVPPQDQMLSLSPPLGAGGFNTTLTSTTHPLSRFVTQGRVLHMTLIQRV